MKCTADAVFCRLTPGIARELAAEFLRTIRRYVIQAQYRSAISEVTCRAKPDSLKHRMVHRQGLSLNCRETYHQSGSCGHDGRERISSRMSCGRSRSSNRCESGGQTPTP